MREAASPPAAEKWPRAARLATGRLLGGSSGTRGSAFNRAGRSVSCCVAGPVPAAPRPTSAAATNAAPVDILAKSIISPVSDSLRACYAFPVGPYRGYILTRGSGALTEISPRLAQQQVRMRQ